MRPLFRKSIATAVLALFVSTNPLLGSQALLNELDQHSGINVDGNTVSVTGEVSIQTANTFNIAQGETVNFEGTTQEVVSQLLIEDLSGQMSTLYGTVNINNLIFGLINKMGIMIGETGRISAVNASAIMSTLSINPEDFFAQNYTFINDDNTVGTITNKGDIDVDQFVAFIGEMINNEGAVAANMGQIVLAAGNQVTLSVDSENLVSVIVDEALAAELASQIPEGSSQISNSGSLTANGGTVLLSASAAKGLFHRAVNHSGVIRAQSFVDRGGKVVLSAEGEDAVVVLADNSVIDVSATEAGAGLGRVTVDSESFLHIEEGAIVKANAVDGSDAGYIDVHGHGVGVLLDGTLEAKGAETNSNAGRIFMNSFHDVESPDGRVQNYKQGRYGIIGETGIMNASGGDQQGGWVDFSGHYIYNHAERPIYVQNKDDQFGKVTFDPFDITFSNGVGDSTDGTTIAGFDGATDPDGLNELFAEDEEAGGETLVFDIDDDGADLIESLGDGVDVSFEATNDITIAAAWDLDLSNAGGNDAAAFNLTLKAGNDILVNANLTTGGATDGSDIVLVADRHVSVANGASINVDGVGTLSITAGGDSLSPETAPDATGDINLNNTTANSIVMGTGALTLIAADAIDVSAAGTAIATSGDVNITADRTTTQDLLITQSGASKTLTITNTNTTDSQDMGFVNAGTTFGAFNITNNTIEGAIDIDITAGAVNDNIAINDGATVARVDEVDLDATNASFTFVQAAGDVTIDDGAGGDADGSTAITAGTGDVSITASAGDITVVATEGVISAGNSANITLDAQGLNSDVTVNASVDTLTDGVITISADDSVILGAGGDVTSATGAITINADDDAADGDGSGVLTQTDGSVISSTSGLITLTSDGGNGGAITVSDVTTGGNITITTDANLEQTTNANGENDTESLEGALLTVDATTGIGTGGAITTAVTTMDIDNATSGNIVITETDAVTVVKLVQATAGNINLTATAGTITLDSAGAPANVVSAAGTGTITLAATGAASDVDINDGVLSGSGTITITADNDILMDDANADITSTSGNITITADSDNGGANSGALTMDDGSLINAGSGKITLSADEDITLGGLLTTSSNVAAVTLTSTEGGIVDGGDTALEIDATNGRLVIASVTGVGEATGSGANPALEMNVDSVVINNTGSGSVKLVETNAVTLNTINATGPGEIDVTAGTTIVVGILDGGPVNLTANQSITGLKGFESITPNNLAINLNAPVISLKFVPGMIFDLTTLTELSINDPGTGIMPVINQPINPFIIKGSAPLINLNSAVIPTNATTGAHLVPINNKTQLFDSFTAPIDSTQVSISGFEYDFIPSLNVDEVTFIDEGFMIEQDFQNAIWGGLWDYPAVMRTLEA